MKSVFHLSEGRSVSIPFAIVHDAIELESLGDLVYLLSLPPDTVITPAVLMRRDPGLYGHPDRAKERLNALVALHYAAEIGEGVYIVSDVPRHYEEVIAYDAQKEREQAQQAR